MLASSTSFAVTPKRWAIVAEVIGDPSSSAWPFNALWMRTSNVRVRSATMFSGYCSNWSSPLSRKLFIFSSLSLMFLTRMFKILGKALISCWVTPYSNRTLTFSNISSAVTPRSRVREGWSFFIWRSSADEHWKTEQRAVSNCSFHLRYFTRRSVVFCRAVSRSGTVMWVWPTSCQTRKRKICVRTPASLNRTWCWELHCNKLHHHNGAVLTEMKLKKRTHTAVFHAISPPVC